MESTGLHRPRVSRETRLLLITALTALIALWVLARIRFPDREVTTPVQPLLTQLGARTHFEDFASDISQLRSRIEPLLAGNALRTGMDTAIMLARGGEGSGPRDVAVLGTDRASGLTVVQAPPLPVPPPVAWRPADLQVARYLVAADTSAGDLALQPVFVGTLVPEMTPLWDQPVWRLPQTAAPQPGTFVFTTDGLLAGLVFDVSGRRAMIPGAVVLAEAARLAAAPSTAPANIDIAVQVLTPTVAKATGSTSGVVVTWVAPQSAAADVLEVGDVIEAVNDRRLTTPLDWQVRTARATAGEAMNLTIRRQGDGVEVVLVPETAPSGSTPSLGLSMRAQTGSGALITDVQPGSAGARAGLRAGDVITLVGDIGAPSPTAVRTAFARADGDIPILVGYTRGSTHHVTALAR